MFPARWLSRDFDATLRGRLHGSEVVHSRVCVIGKASVFFGELVLPGADLTPADLLLKLSDLDKLRTAE